MDKEDKIFIIGSVYIFITVLLSVSIIIVCPDCKTISLILTLIALMIKGAWMLNYLTDDTLFYKRF